MRLNLRALALVLGLCALGSGAKAQNYIRIPTCGTAAPPAGAGNAYMDSTGNVCTSAAGGSGGPVTIAGPLVSNAGSAVATGASNVPTVSYNYGFNGATWDQLQVDAQKTLKTVPTPIAAAPTVGASGAITSLVLKGSPTAATGGVRHFHAENSTTTGGYCILYNATAAPSPGALTANLVLKFQLLPASGYCDWQANSVDVVAASAGAVLLVSSAATPYTYTTGVITASLEGLAQ